MELGKTLKNPMYSEEIEREIQIGINNKKRKTKFAFKNERKM